MMKNFFILFILTSAIIDTIRTRNMIYGHKLNEFRCLEQGNTLNFARRKRKISGYTSLSCTIRGMHLGKGIGYVCVPHVCVCMCAGRHRHTHTCGTHTYTHTHTHTHTYALTHIHAEKHTHSHWDGHVHPPHIHHTSMLTEIRNVCGRSKHSSIP